MLTFLGKKINFFDIELTNICALRCPRCPRTQGPITNEKRYLDLDFFKFSFHKNLKGLNRPIFCFEGNYGDCIYHPELLSIIRYLKESFDAKIEITTNGSGKTAFFWQELCNLLDKNDRLIFSIDGLSMTNHLYRIGSNWESIITGIKESVGKVNTCWKLVYFSHNENDIETISSYAKKLGIDEFLMVKSKRFRPAGKDELRPNNQNLISSISENKSVIKKILKINNDEEIVSNISLRPFCLDLNNGTNFISYDGFLSPCCVSAIYHEASPNFPFISNKELRELSNLRIRPIDEVFSDDRWNIFSSLNDNNQRHCNECYKRCGIHLAYMEQFREEEYISYLKEDRNLSKI